MFTLMGGLGTFGTPVTIVARRFLILSFIYPLPIKLLCREFLMAYPENFLHYSKDRFKTCFVFQGC
ncbi:MAG TPA: hypothetical protein DCP92_01255 [Nitrospiraceae bacterium]|nr:hypothetical protein [Nitrospiraceae bacterium]